MSDQSVPWLRDSGVLFRVSESIGNMPSVPVELFLRPLAPSLTIFHGGSSSHRLKRLEKGDRRGNLS